MTTLDIDSFLHSLCTWVVAQAAALSTPATIPYGGSGGQLFRWEADEDTAGNAGLYSVITPYGGRPESSSWTRPKPIIALQVATFAAANKAGGGRAQMLFDLIATDIPEGGLGSPCRMRTIPGLLASDSSGDGSWLLINADYIQRPGLVGRNDRNQGKWVFNVNLGIQKAS